MNAAQRIILFAQQRWRTYRSALAGNVPKSLWNPNDLALQYQESTGVTPAALEQPVGLVLDSLTKGQTAAELVSNGDFSAGTTGWSTNSGTPLSVSSGRLVITSSGAGSVIASEPITLVIGKAYEFTCDFIDVSGSGVGLNLQSAQFGSTVASDSKALGPGSSGQLKFVGIATATNMWIGPRISNAIGAGQTASFDNISVREIPGNHIIQPTSTARPILSAISGFQGWNYNGVDTNIATANTPFNPSLGYVAFAAVRLDSATQVDLFSTGAVTANNALMSVVANKLRTQQWGSTATVTTVDSPLTYATAGTFVFAQKVFGGRIYGYANGVKVIDAALNEAPASASFVVSSGRAAANIGLSRKFPWGFYNGDMSDARILALSKLLARDAGITI